MLNIYAFITTYTYVCVLMHVKYSKVLYDNYNNYHSFVNNIHV